MKPITIKGPFESRKAAENLRDQLIDHLAATDVTVGEPFFSDAELVDLSGLSRKTVRKALSELHREGWIERQPGKGTFVGVRATMPLAPRQRVDSSRRSIVRLAVLAYGMDAQSPDWYSQGVLSGLDAAAYDAGVAIELLGNWTQDATALSRRLLQTQPDVLLVMPSTSRHAYMAGEAQRQGIPCLLTGTRLLDLSLPTVCEDNHQGAALAVKHLHENGHRRIGLLQRPDTATWVFERRQGYVDALRDCGLEHDERLVWWQDPRDENPSHSLRTWWLQHKPTAVIASNAMSAVLLEPLCKDGTVRIPQELAVVSFDQCTSLYRQHLNFMPTVIELPLHQIGTALSQLARDVVENDDAGEDDTKHGLENNAAASKVIRIACNLIEGESVQPPATSS